MYKVRLQCDKCAFERLNKRTKYIQQVTKTRQPGTTTTWNVSVSGTTPRASSCASHSCRPAVRSIQPETRRVVHPHNANTPFTMSTPLSPCIISSSQCGTSDTCYTASSCSIYAANTQYANSSNKGPDKSVNTNTTSTITSPATNTGTYHARSSYGYPAIAVCSINAASITYTGNTNVSANIKRSTRTAICSDTGAVEYCTSIACTICDASTGSARQTERPQPVTSNSTRSAESYVATRNAAERWRTSWRNKQRSEAGPATEVSRGQSSVPEPLMAMQHSLARIRAIVKPQQRKKHISVFWLSIVLLVCLMVGLTTFILSTYSGNTATSNTVDTPPTIPPPSLTVKATARSDYSRRSNAACSR